MRFHIEFRFGLMIKKRRKDSKKTLIKGHTLMDPACSQDYNRYTYARNNLLIYIDPSGESLKDWWRKIFGKSEGNSNVAKEHMSDGGGSFANAWGYNIGYGIGGGDGGMMLVAPAYTDGSGVHWGPLFYNPNTQIYYTSYAGNANTGVNIFGVSYATQPDYSIMNNWDYWNRWNYVNRYNEGNERDGVSAPNPPVTQPAISNAPLSGTDFEKIVLLKEKQQLIKQQMTLLNEMMKLKELQLNEHRRFIEQSRVVKMRILFRTVLFLCPNMNINDSANSFFPESMLEDIDRKYDAKEKEIYEKYRKY